MRHSSMRGNLLALAGLYLASLVVASGCPAKQQSTDTPASVPSASINAPVQQPVLDAQPETAASAGETDPAADEPAPKKKTPIELNGRFFEGWAKPKLALLITGCQEGYLEPCGCAGLENQKGGIGRRHALVKELEGKGWPLAAVDVGDQVRRFGTQADLQFKNSAEALKTMGYDSVGFGPADLRLSVGEVLVGVTGNDIFVSANVDLLGFPPKFRIVEAGGMKLGITSILGKKGQEQVNNAEVSFIAAEAGIAAVLPELAGCDRRILLAHASLEEATQLAKRFPEFDIVVAASDFDEPPAYAREIGKTQLIEVGHKAMFAIVLGFYDDPKPRYQRVALDSRYNTTPEMKQVMVTLQDNLRELGFEGLGIRAKPHPHAAAGDKLAGQFVGTAQCKACHAEAWDVWSNSKHAHATDSLVNADPPRQFDAECLSCHVTGWSPQEFVPFASGFDSLKTTPHLAGNGCENCHGPGAAHVAAETGNDQAQRKAARELLRLVIDEKGHDGCVKCHDHDNSPEYKFEKYWPDIAH